MTIQDPLGYYQILDITPTARDTEIKQHYRDLAKKWHPDYNSNPESIEKFQKLSIAYDILQDEQHRLFYDLLSQVYQAHNFPDMFSLAIYKDRAGQENPFIRTISQQKVIGKFIRHSFRQDSDICNSAEAPTIILKNAISNWLFGWWSAKAFIKNIQAIAYNYASINNNSNENLTLLIHNAIAYYQEGKKDKAFASAVQAREYATTEQQYLLDKFIRLTGYSNTNFRSPTWNYNKLKLLQLLPPFMIGIVIFLPILSHLTERIAPKSSEITYFQTVEFNNGERTFDDVVISKIVSIPVNYSDDNKLYHTTSTVDVKYGPADEFDILVRLNVGHTVRITGYTPDNRWYRIMIDSGDMGFVRSEMLKKGINSPIPHNSKIISN